MVQYAPYTPDMNIGQGYNTFMQEVSVEGAVTVTSGGTPPAPYNRTYSSTLVTDYRQLTQSLNITAGAAVSKWGQSGKVNMDYLDRKEFESSDITYEVKVDIEHQGRATNKYDFNWISPKDPNVTYGDYFIADFVRGGHYYALVHITSKSEGHTKEVKQAAEVAMSMYGAEGQITDEVKAALSTLAKYSKTRIVIDESGGGSQLRKADDTDLEAVKHAADDFFKNADQQGYIKYAILEKYQNVPNFKDEFKPFDYFVAIQKSYPFLDEFSRYMSFQPLIENVPGDKFINGQPQKDVLQDKRVGQVELIHNRILEIRDDPDNADYTQPQVPATAFWTDFLCAVRTAEYIAQRVPTPKGGLSDSIQATLQPGAEKLFDVNVYDFDSLDGTRLVSFGSDVGNDSYIAVIGIHANSVPGWNEDSYFYVFTSDIDKVTGDLIRVSSLSSKNYIRVARQAPNSGPTVEREQVAAGKDLFTFRGSKAQI